MKREITFNVKVYTVEIERITVSSMLSRTKSRRIEVVSSMIASTNEEGKIVKSDR